MLILVLLVLALVLYLALKTSAISKRQTSMAVAIDADLKAIRTAQETSPPGLVYGWYDDGWPFLETTRGEANPKPHQHPDEYVTAMFAGEYKSIASPHARKRFLAKLRQFGVWTQPELLDAVYADENPFVRAWAAAHLNTDFTDYADSKNPRTIRDYESSLLKDPAPIVRAALWSNPKSRQLPWYVVGVGLKEAWKEQFRNMSQIERLGLMRNPELGKALVLALLESSSEELGVTRDQHREILCAAAINADLISGSRRTGRGAWVGGGEGNAPFEEYGQMWELCSEKWLGEPSVPFFFFRYIQTTPEVKLATYQRLLAAKRSAEYAWLRQEIIRSCDPLDDKEILKLGWDDPDDKCREAAKERVGIHARLVGVQAND